MERLSRCCTAGWILVLCVFAAGCSLYEEPAPLPTGQALTDAGVDAADDGGASDAADVSRDVDDCEPSPERCDGLDNDCDGVIDEQCPCNYGGSKAGVCQYGKIEASGNCASPEDYEAFESLCDGKDNDCDGEIDPDCECTDGEQQNCYTGPSETLGVGACAEGERVCAEGRWKTCVGEVVPVDETCDGADNDCDGVTDEGCPCEFNSASTGVCGTAVIGEQSGECEPPAEYEATESACDGLDNDCNRVVDERCSCNFGGITEGVCVNAVISLATGQCQAPPTYESQETLCDNRDNDCDGVVDENCACDYTNTDEGVCGGASISPVDGQCAEPADYEADEAACDGVDNDCDGVVDENCGCDYNGKSAGVCATASIDPNTGQCATPFEFESTESSCDGLDNDCNLVVDERCACDYNQSTVGVCASGVIGVATGNCEPPASFQNTESNCDGLDNDCDGVADEGCGCQYSGTSEGVCSAGVINASSGQCEAPSDYQSDETRCDSIDNDCDGVTDEGCVCDYTNKSTGVCSGGTIDASGQCSAPSDYQSTEFNCDGVDNDCDAVTDENCQCNYDELATGVCADGVISVSTGQCVAPSNYQSTESNCDGFDNDCDGVIDEGCGCNYTGSSTGVCAGGVVETSTGNCLAPPNYEADESACDGADNDCDGVTDEGCSCDYDGSKNGVCSDGTVDTAGVCQPPTNYEADESLCDGLDNDCDGIVDERCQCDYDGTSTGVCSGGVISVSTGLCSEPSSYEPGETSCDGRDNDCDGVTDEGCSCDYASTSTGVCSGGVVDSTGVCTAPASYQSTESVCDDKDNDCDGAADEGCSCNYSGTNTGVCSGGTVSTTGVCEPPSNYEESESLCDGADNDCDGVADEGCSCDYSGLSRGVCTSGTINTSGVCEPPRNYESDETTCDSDDNDCDGAVDEGCLCDYNGTSVGVCSGGKVDSSGVCQAPSAYESSEASCDGFDNDCDGVVDEGCQCDYAATSVGVCADGTIASTDGTCQAPSSYESTESLCDGLDNDCDGQVDEGCPCNYDGISTGVCSNGQKDGVGGCLAPTNYESNESTCDTLDNDCDGTTDEQPDYTEDFEDSDSDWYTYKSASNTPTVKTDATDRVHGGSQAGYAHYNTGVCGVAGLARDFTLPGDAQTLTVWVSAKSDNWARNTIMLEDSSGLHVLWRKKGSGSSYDMSWTELTLDISSYDNDFTLIFGNDDNSSYCTMSDHTWWLWVDDISISQVCR